MAWSFWKGFVIGEGWEFLDRICKGLLGVSGQVVRGMVGSFGTALAGCVRSG